MGDCDVIDLDVVCSECSKVVTGSITQYTEHFAVQYLVRNFGK